MERTRVVVWGTGNAGRRALKGVIEHPELELVGVHAHSPAKLGKDACELAGLTTPTGVLATDDVDALLDLRPDCIAYMAMGEFRPKEMTAEVCRILEAGINVVSVSNASLVYPPSADRRIVDKLRAAAELGGTTMLTTGIDPGWSGDVLPLLLTALCERVDSITVSEVMDYGTYPDAELTGWAMGFGRRPEEDIPLFMPGAATGVWSPTVQLVADALGVELNGFEEELEYRLAPETFEVAMGTMAEGTIAAVRFAVKGMRGGRPVITAVHCNRIRADIAPDWPVLTNGKQDGYLIEVVGSPSVTCQIELADEHGDNNGAGIIGTAMRAINAIPAVIAAPPGLVTPLDLPTICARGLVA
jgi:hypothetical protein